MQTQNLFYIICGIIFSMLFSSCVVPGDPNSGGDGPHIRIEPGYDADWERMARVPHNDFNEKLIRDTVSVGDTISLHPAINSLGFGTSFDSLVVAVLINKTEILKKNMEVDKYNITFVIPQNCNSGWLQVVSVTKDMTRMSVGMFFDTIGGKKLTIR